MMKRWMVLAMGSVLLCAVTLPSMASRGPVIAPPTASPAITEKEIAVDSMLYYGTVKEILRDQNGVITQLHMNSELYGDYVMNLSPETFWIDGSSRMASDPSDLTEGEHLYVFHSSMVTRSLPPQSAALAIVRNIPMDAGCPQHHTVEAVSLEDGQLKITTDHGGLVISADGKTGLSRYGTKAALRLSEIQPGDQLMAWYEAYAATDPGQTYAHHLMLLSETDSVPMPAKALTRRELVSMLYEKAGRPGTDHTVQYTDVAADADYGEAIRWAAGEQLVSGYGDGSFGPEDLMNREQLVTILWNYAGRPMLMDYPDLLQFPDAAELSRFAQPAMAWAHQQELITGTTDGRLAPQGLVTWEMAATMLNAVETKD